LAGSTLAGHGGYLAQTVRDPARLVPKRALTRQTFLPHFLFQDA